MSVMRSASAKGLHLHTPGHQASTLLTVRIRPAVCMCRALSPSPGQNPDTEPAPASASNTTSATSSKHARRSIKRRPNSGPEPDDPRNQRPTELQLIAGHAAYTGTLGTLAVVAANVLHVDLFAMFDWNLQHLAFGLALLIPLQIANAAVLGPDWSSWKLPTLTEAEQAEALQQGSSSAVITPAANPTSTTSAAAPELVASAAPALVPAAAWGVGPLLPAAGAPSHWSLAPRWPSQPTLRDALHLTQGHYTANNPTASLGTVAELGVAAFDSLASEMLFRGVLLTSMAHWLQACAYESGAEDLVQVPAAVARLIHACAALHPDPTAAVGAVAAASSSLVGLDEASRWGAAACMLGLTSLLSLRRVGMTLRKVGSMQELRARIRQVRQLQQQKDARLQRLRGTADAAVQDVLQAVQTQSEAQAAAGDSPHTQTSGDSLRLASHADSLTAPAQGQQQHQAAVLPTAEASAATGPEGMAGSMLPLRPHPLADTSAPEPSRRPAAPPLAGPLAPRHSQSTERQPRPAPLPPAPPQAQLEGLARAGVLGLLTTGLKGRQQGLALAAVSAGSASGGPGGASGDSGRDAHTFMDALVWAAAFQASRDLLQGATLALVFVGSGGNLAAAFAASFVNQVVFSQLQRYAAERTRQRSAAMVEELEAFNTQLRQVAAKAQQAKAAAVAADTALAAEVHSSTQARQVKPSASLQLQPHEQVVQPRDSASKLGRALGTLDMLVPEQQREADGSNTGSTST